MVVVVDADGEDFEDEDKDDDAADPIGLAMVTLHAAHESVSYNASTTQANGRNSELFDNTPLFRGDVKMSERLLAMRWEMSAFSLICKIWKSLMFWGTNCLNALFTVLTKLWLFKSTKSKVSGSAIVALMSAVVVLLQVSQWLCRSEVSRVDFGNQISAYKVTKYGVLCTKDVRHLFEFER